jgi:hypothetical protein
MNTWIRLLPLLLIEETGMMKQRPGEQVKAGPFWWETGHSQILESLFVCVIDRSVRCALSGLTFDPHAWNSPFVIEIDNQSFLDLSTTLCAIKS